jgi:periplasmic divalent cation tolerance protein
MKPAVFTELALTCGSWQEAQTIADSLLDKHLVACVEMLEVKSQYHWQGNKERTTEVKLLMHTIMDKWEKIEAEVKRLLSHKVFNLQALPLSQMSKEAQVWLQAETKGIT